MSSPQQIEWFGHALRYVADFMARFQQSLSAREKLIASIALHSAHAEEAIAVGDAERAHAHIRQLEGLLKQLNGGL